MEQKRANIGRFIISIMVAFLLQWMIHEANRQTSGGSILFHNFFLAVMQRVKKNHLWCFLALLIETTAKSTSPFQPSCLSAHASV